MKLKELLLTAVVSCFVFAPINGQPGAFLASQPPQGQSPDLVKSRELNATVMKLYGEGKYDEAIPLARRALELREKALGPDHKDLVPLLANLGELFRSKRKYSDAESYFARALKVNEKAFGKDDLSTAQLLEKLAVVVYEMRDERRAEDLFQRALTMREGLQGAEHLDVAQTAFNLAEVYRLRREYQKAEPLYQRVIRIREEMKGSNNAELIKALNAYATLLFSVNRRDEGLQIQKRIAELSSGPRMVEVGVLNGKALSLPAPDYPMMAAEARAEGVVRVRVTIDENGNVIDAKAMDAGGVHIALVTAAEKAARRARFTPTVLSGVPIKVTGVIVYNFVRRRN
jgi:TonB family protein